MSIDDNTHQFNMQNLNNIRNKIIAKIDNCTVHYIFYICVINKTEQFYTTHNI